VSALASLGDGFRALARSWGLAVTLLLVNLGTAAVLAVPLAGEMEGALAQSESARRMLYGFDYSWWSAWHDARTGYEGAFGPDILGAGFVYKNVDLLLRGYLPMGLFAPRAAEDEALVDPVTLGLGALYLLVQVFLAGGVLSVLRAAQGAWTTRGLLHGSGFYFGRFARITLLALVVVGLLFGLNAPLTRFAERQAGEAVSETAAMAWLIGRHAVLLAALVFVHLIASYARVITVVEDRRSAVMAFFSSAVFCLRHVGAVVLQGALVGLAGLLLIAIWTGLDRLWPTTGYKTQIVTLLLAEALMLGRIGLRLALQGSQIALYRRTQLDR
jgi:hypothetical protein